MAGARIPDFFIVGHPKSGTTALHHMLRSHPQIYMPELKETRFFAGELHPRGGPGDPTPRSVEEYSALFAPAAEGQRTGEASPSYLRSKLAAGRIAELRPDARIIAILREPVSFLHSMHMELMRDHAEIEPDFAKALALGPERKEAEQRGGAPGLVYMDYVEQLRRYQDAFGRDQMLVLLYDDFRADNQAVLKRVMSFLGVDAEVAVEQAEVNPSVRVRSPRANEMLRSLYLGRGPAGRLLKAPLMLVPRRARRRAMGVVQRRAIYGEPRRPDERVAQELREHLRGEVVALSDYLGEDLVERWGYDEP
jgi:hypothetical protein